MTETIDPTKEEIIEMNNKCNECEYGAWIKGEFSKRKTCTLGFEPEVCNHDLEKFEDD